VKAMDRIIPVGSLMKQYGDAIAVHHVGFEVGRDFRPIRTKWSGQDSSHLHAYVVDEGMREC
jgi:hypothetical protein